MDRQRFSKPSHVGSSPIRGIYKKENIMRFSYVKSDAGEIVIAVAYEEVADEEVIYYGVSVISPDEKFSDKPKAKSIAQSRCLQSSSKGFLVNSGIEWKPYFVDGEPDLHYRNSLINYCETKGWKKLGCMKTEDFIANLKLLKNI